MARKSDQIWQVLSGAPATPAQPEGLVVFKPDQAWAAQSQLADGGFQNLQQRHASLLFEENVSGLVPVVKQLQQAFFSHQEKQKSFQAALVAKLLALGNQVDAMQTQQQLRLVDTSHISSSRAAWLSLTPKIQQAQEEVQASSDSAGALALSL
ncbi:TPA: hypothetical protein ACH3X2_007977 [Trebouxia sp. C0005]